MKHDLIILDAWNKATDVLETFYFSTGKGFSSSPTDAPAHTAFRPSIKKSLTVRRDILSEGTTIGRVRVGIGRVALNNGDGALDFLMNYGLDGRRFEHWRGDEGSAVTSGYTQIFAGTMEQAIIARPEVDISLRDKQAILDRPFNVRVYNGQNELIVPNGLEGNTADLRGKQKPTLFGVVKNVPLTLVNDSKLIYQVRHNDATDVFQRGFSFGNGIWAMVTGFALGGDSGSLFLSRDLITWGHVPHGIGTETEVEFLDDNFYVLGTSQVLVSTDSGQSWIAYDHNLGDTPRAIASNGSTLVLVGDGGKLNTSTDGGKTWTVRTSGHGSSDIKDTCHDGSSTFLIVGNDGKVSTSADGITWNLETTAGFGTDNVRRCAFGASLFVITGGDGGATALVETSPGGTTWTDRVINVGTETPFELEFHGTVFVWAGNLNTYKTSADGITWTARTNPFGSAILGPFGFDGKRHVVGNLGGTGADGGDIATSTDAITWTQIDDISSIDAVYDRGSKLGFGYDEFTSQTSQFTTDTVFRIALGNSGQLVAVGANAKLSTSANNGETWVARTSGFTSDIINDVVWSESLSLWIAVGEAGKLFTSMDGVTWTSRTSAFGSTAINAIAANADGSRLVIVGDSGKVAHSTNGTSWTLGTGGVSTANIFSVVYSAYYDLFFFGTTAAQLFISWSDDNGSTWTKVTAGSAGLGQSNDLAVGNEVIITVANSGTIATTNWAPKQGRNWLANASGSTSGSTWATNHVSRAIFNADGALFIAVGDLGKVAFSYDGREWRTISVNGWGVSDQAWAVVVAADGRLVIGGEQGQIFTSEVPAAFADSGDMMDDDQAPPWGTYDFYNPMGLLRLGGRPIGQITADVTEGAAAADRTARGIAERVLWGAGLVNPLNLVTDDDISAWTSEGTPVVAAVADPWGGTDGWSIEDNDGAAAEAKRFPILFHLDGAKTLSFVISENTMPASGNQTLELIDDTAAATRLQLDISAWVDGLPTVTASTGTLLRVTRVDQTASYLVEAIAPGVIAANTNNVHIFPASASTTGIINVYRVRAYDEPTDPDGDWSWLDMLRLDVDNTAEMGFFSRFDELTFSDVLTKIAKSVGAWFGFDRTGKFRFKVLKAPSADTARRNFIESHMKKGIRRIGTSDKGAGLPVFRTTMRYGRNYTPQKVSDLVGGLSETRLAELGREWAGDQSSASSAVRLAHPLAVELEIETLFTTAADATTEGKRVRTLRQTLRDRFEFSVELNDANAVVDLGDVGNVTHSRFLLTGGKDFRIMSVEPDVRRNRILLGVWG